MSESTIVTLLVLHYSIIVDLLLDLFLFGLQELMNSRAHHVNE